jgi:Protein kinase domain
MKDKRHDRGTPKPGEASAAATLTQRGRHPAAPAAAAEDESQAEEELRPAPRLTATTTSHQQFSPAAGRFHSPLSRSAKVRVAFLQTFVMLGLTILLQQQRPSEPASFVPRLPMAEAAEAERSSSQKGPPVHPRQARNFPAAVDGSSDASLPDVVDVDDDDDDDGKNEDPAAEQAGIDADATSSSPRMYTDVIIVATVDGSLAGLCRESGRLLWIRSRPATTGAPPVDGERERDEDDDDEDGLENASRRRRILRPLVSTTTTKQSTRTRRSSHGGTDGKTTAVPSIDGSVYLTALAPHGPTTDSASAASSSSSQHHHHHQVQRHEVTVTTSVPELVSRSPFVDARGRIYTGARQSLSFAVDGETGEVLHLVPDGGEGEGGPASARTAAGARPFDAADPTRNVVWLGRVDYSVSVHEARTGELDVQFASAHIMGVNDMLLSSKPASGAAPHSASERFPYHADFHHSAASSAVNPVLTTTSLLSAVAGDSLVATPNGRVAFRNQQGQISWVSDATFDTPVAFAVDSLSGSSLAVDIVPDATVPDGSTDYVSKEMERQMTIAEQQQNDMYNAVVEDGAPNDYNGADDMDGTDDQTIVGFLPSGDLFALPLGRRRGAAKPMRSSSYGRGSPSSILHQSHHATASSSSATAAASTLAMNKVPGRHSMVHLYHQHQSPEESSKPPKKLSCHPGGATFPECLVSEGGSQYVPAYFLTEPSSDEHAEMVGLVVKHQQTGDWDVPPHYYTIVQPPDKRNRRYQKVLRILGSWLPPTIALLFVVSFELGRRKRQEQHTILVPSSQSTVSTALSTVSANVDRVSTAADSHPNESSATSESAGVIQVMSDVILGYGGHGTVVYKGLLEGRQVAVKRMLRTYLASADREISLLIESDGHPNVVRYFLKEVRGDFVYLALELCDMSLHDLILKLKCRQDQREKENQSPEAVVPSATRNVLFQIANGVKHLHGLRIVHRSGPIQR